jgi:DNA (cytosine-5)-methyltransferase 1
MTYQFYGRSYPEKQKMIGNAIPPVFTYYLAKAMQKAPARNLTSLPKLGYKHLLPEDTPALTPPDQIGRRYPAERRFWFAIQNLRFKSGMRFDLANKYQVNRTDWSVEFYFGPSKDIRSIELDAALLERIRSLNWLGGAWNDLERTLNTFRQNVEAADLGAMQNTWTDKSADGPHPFLLLDLLGDTAASLIKLFPKEHDEEAANFVNRTAVENCPNRAPVNVKKFHRYGTQVFCGLLLGSSFNSRSSQVQSA